MPTTLVWFRQDLRVADNPALLEAARRGAVVPVYIHDDETPARWRTGGAGRWWLARSLAALNGDLEALGSALVVATGDPLAELQRLAAEVEADGVVWNRCYEPFAVARDETIKRTLRQRGLTVWSTNGSLLFEPWTVATQSGGAFQVYTPFARACLAAPPPSEPVRSPDRLHSPKVLSTTPIRSIFDLGATLDWTTGLEQTWSPGSSFASKALTNFLKDKIEDYRDNRDRPDLLGTSRLSPHLHWGELSPRQAWHTTVRTLGSDATFARGSGSETFLKELLWREFAYHILYHAPQLPETPLKPAFDAMPWADVKANRNAWRFARTGYPIVDAGMRQLRSTGWMHNRVRMIVGSFLVKHLLEDWRHGAAWFWDNLVDADLASNTLGWQWVAGCGPDAAPYFRIFNPVLQGQKFDPDGAYVRRWVPELEPLPVDWLHRPWEAPDDVLAKAGIVLGRTYPRPVVEHKWARNRALAALEHVKRAA